MAQPANIPGLELKPGTLGRQTFPEFRFTETDSPDVIKCYPTFVFHPVYKEFSLEEHRFADYVLLNRNPDRPNKAVTEFAKNSTLKLLSGKGVEILVGTTPSQDETWSLPVNLLSHHSAYFKAACLWDVKGQINLLDHDPAVFALFVEWMYNGTYDASAFPRNPNIHAKCWVLGDYIICRQFQNYAMGRLFDEHVATAFGIPIGFEDVQYVCNSASSDSKLKLFYTDFVTDHFGDIYRLRGYMADWEKFLEDHPKTRSALLRKLRYGPPKKPRVKSVTKYLEPEESVSESALRAQADFARLADKKEDQVSKPAGQDDSEKRFSFNVDALPPVRGLHWGTPATPLVHFFPTEDTATPLAPNASSQSAVASPLQFFPPKSMAAPVSNPSSQGTAVPSVPKSSQATGAPTLQLFRPQVKPVSIAAKVSQSTAAPSAANSFPQGTATLLLSNASSRVTVAPSVLNLSSQDSAAVLPVSNSLQSTAALSVPDFSQGTAAPPAPNASSQDTAAPVDRVEEGQEKKNVGDETNTVSNATQDATTKASSLSESTSGSTSNDGPESQNTPGSGED